MKANKTLNYTATKNNRAFNLVRLDNELGNVRDYKTPKKGNKFEVFSYNRRNKKVMEKKDGGVISVIKNIPQQQQVQYSTEQQLFELRIAANKLGLYDAADYIKNKMS